MDYVMVILFSARLVFWVVFVTSLSNFLLHATDDDIKCQGVTPRVTYKFEYMNNCEVPENSNDYVRKALLADLMTDPGSFAVAKRILSKLSQDELEKFYFGIWLLKLRSEHKPIELVLVDKFEGIVSHVKCGYTLANIVTEVSSIPNNEQTVFFDYYSALITPEISGQNVLMYIETLYKLPNRVLSHLVKIRPKYFSRVSIKTIHNLVNYAKVNKMDEVEFWRRLIMIYPSGLDWFSEAVRYWLRRSVTTNDPELWKVFACGWRDCFDFGRDGESFWCTYHNHLR